MFYTIFFTAVTIGVAIIGVAWAFLIYLTPKCVHDWHTIVKVTAREIGGDVEISGTGNIRELRKTFCGTTSVILCCKKCGKTITEELIGTDIK